jgi:hypothetical protein
MVKVCAGKRRPTAALHDGGILGQHGKVETVPEVSLVPSAVELKSSPDREGDQPGRSWMASVAEKESTVALAQFRATVVGVY